MTTQRLRVILGTAAAAGICMMPVAARAQDAPASPPNAEQAPDFAKVRGMVREMVELKRAGKQDEANQVAERIKAATHNNPRVTAMLERHQKGEAPAVREKRAQEGRPDANVRENRPNPEGAANASPVARLRHLRVAAAHLEAAGVKGLADSVRAQIARMEKPAKGPGAGLQTPGQPGPRIKRPGGNDQAMRFEQAPSRPFGAPQQGFGTPPVRQRGDFQGPRQQGLATPPVPQRGGFQSPRQQGFGGQAPAAGDANAALLDEIRKLRAEMGELRGQVQRLQLKEDAPR